MRRHPPSTTITTTPQRANLTGEPPSPCCVLRTSTTNPRYGKPPPPARRLQGVRRPSGAAQCLWPPLLSDQPKTHPINFQGWQFRCARGGPSSLPCAPARYLSPSIAPAAASCLSAAPPPSPPPHLLPSPRLLCCAVLCCAAQGAVRCALPARDPIHGITSAASPHLR